ncbi:MAG TPA: tRNA pseudouridine(38-40) synthase TruA [Rhodospirillales bacterium]|jgi:tRNA pseudouridine38-40 synthase|nr:tRNA pseudouridine(38-40) synthase TruA [Rhodospirillales bacterium]
MPRYKITVEYDGSGFVGWQRQKNGLAVQQVLEEAIAGFSGETVTLYAAGRTDAGVHALGQVAHFDLPREFATDTVRDAINFHVKPAPVAVLKAEPAKPGFDARRSAHQRRYLYRLCNRRAEPVLERKRAWWVATPLDWAAMAEAARVLTGKHDFTTFRAINCQAASPVKTLDELGVGRDGDFIFIRAHAKSFMHHQVRNIVGTLKLVGEGKWTAGGVTAALEARDRARGGPTAPPEGLYLVGVLY